MGMDNKHNNRTRPSAQFGYPLDMERFRKIRDREFAREIETMDVNVIHACSMLLTGNLEVGEAQRERAWQKLMERIRHEQAAKGRRTVLRYILIGLLGLLLVAGICAAAGWLPWIVEISWDYDRWHMDISRQKHEATYPEVAYNDALDAKFIDVLKDMDINIELPSSLPKDFMLHHVRSDNTTEDIYDVSAYYQRPDGTFLNIWVTRFTADGVMSLKIEKNPEEPEHYIFNDAEYIIYKNIGRMGVRWQKDPYVIGIVGDITRDEIIEMIHSIGK